MFNLVRLNSIIVVLFSTVIIGFGQNVSSGPAVKWEMLNGKNNEFAVYMPANYMVTGQNEYYLGNSETLVDKELKIARYINGVVLIMEYYEGKAKEIQKILQEREKLIPEKELQINGFLVKNFSGQTEKMFRQTQHFQLKERLYVIKAIAKSKDDKILKGFFESVRLINQDKIVAPNAPPEAQTTSLPNLVEKETPRLDDSSVVSTKEVDRELIVLNTQRPRFSAESKRGLNSFSARLKVLYSASGKVTNVEVLEITSKLLEKEVIEAAKNVVFIPAEKDGKFVSVSQIVGFSFGIVNR